MYGTDLMHLRIFLASPGDVADERARAFKVIDELQYEGGLRGKVTLEAVAWDKTAAGTPMLATLTPQEAIARGLPKPSECDIVVAIFWSRMGTPLPPEWTKPDGSRYLSGTEWEYWDAWQAAKQGHKPEILVYRRDEVPMISLADPQKQEKEEQWQRVEAFFAAFKNPDGSIPGGINPYKTTADFESILRAHLRDRIWHFLKSYESATARRELLIPRDDATPRPLPEALRMLYDAVGGDDSPVALPPATIEEIIRHEPGDLTEYRLTRIAAWSQPKYALDKRFVQLTLLMDQGEEAQGPRWAPQPRKFQDLSELLPDVSEQALVLLGPPGSGKSTLLRRFELDCAVAALRSGPADKEVPLSFFIELNRYKPAHPGDPLPLPKEWLAARWAARYPGLPDLDSLLRQRCVVLLLDALNEMAHPGVEPIGLWKNFLAELAHDRPGNRVIFSCRSLDYSASLSTPDLPVPQIQIEALSDEQVQDFLEAYSPEHGAAIWDELKGSPQLALLRSPFYLKLLLTHIGIEGKIPKGRVALFTSFVRQALKREIAQDHLLFRPGVLLAKRDCERLAQARTWRTPYELPSRGILFPKLSRLAYQMQELGGTAESSQVRIEYDQACNLLDHPQAEDILEAGEALGVLEEDPGRDEVLYTHQLLQEYFAARCLAAEPGLERVRTVWQAEEISPSLEETLAQLADSDPLPPAPATGWEETAVLAAAMTTNADHFVSALIDANLPLAGRCAAQPDVLASAVLKDRIRQALIARTRDPNADLRARIAAGLALGNLGDPRFERRRGPDGDYLLPPLMKIPGGRYPIGSDEGRYEDETPAHTVELTPLAMGKFPVTNAEWRLFMDADGYEDQRWWDTEVAKVWQRGEGTAEGPKQQWREDRQYLQQHFDEIRDWHQAGQITSKQADDWEQIARMGDDEFETLLEQWYPPGRHTQLAYWDDNAFNNPAQPVVGICWHEARAYGNWLAAQTGQPFRLPSEAEWEAAARGSQGRRYAYGDEFSAARCNTFETHIRRTTPIGVFPAGETPEGLVDMTGNVWEWTGSLYKPYPYRSDDGREDSKSGGGRRVVRGGSWTDAQGDARAACRLNDNPDGRVINIGFRVCRSSPT